MHDYEKVLNKAKTFTRQKLERVRAAASKLDLYGCEIVIIGSYARQEASAQSDFDYFILHPPGISTKNLDNVQRNVAQIVKAVVGKAPSKDGAFGTALEAGSLCKNIGGNEDTNQNITRRVLFLVEGVPLASRELFDKQKADLIDRYIGESITDHQLGMFFLNDLIRYYRTICIDFEYKTYESTKAWGTRNIKLIFSRKLLYFSGVLVAAELAQRSPLEKKEIATALTQMSPIERVRSVCRTSADRAIESYAHFLSEMEKKATRDLLDKITNSRDSHNEKFRRFKNNGHHFGYQLLGALKSTYAESHPIHRALIM